MTSFKRHKTLKFGKVHVHVADRRASNDLFNTDEQLVPVLFHTYHLQHDQELNLIHVFTQHITLTVCITLLTSNFCLTGLKIVSTHK